MLIIDKLSYQSKLRYVNAGEKFGFSVATLILCVASRSVLLGILVFAVMGILTVWKGGIPLWRYLKLMTIPLTFLMLNVVILGLSIRRTPLEVFAISFGNWYLTASKETLYYAFQIFVTAMASVSCLYFLSCNTPMTDILNVLKKLRCPKLLIELMMLIYRFIFVLLDCAQEISISQKSRLGNIDYRTSLKSFGTLVSALFVRAVIRSGFLYDAMESRCYDGDLRVLCEDHPPKKKEILMILCFEGLLLAIAVIVR